MIRFRPERRAKSAAALVAILCGALAAASAEAQRASRDQGDWPCRQVKVPTLSAETVWPGSLPANAGAWRDDPALSALVAGVAARRTALDAAEKSITDYAATLGDKRREKLALLFAGVFETLDAERHEVIAGLDRYGRRQKEAAEKLRDETQTLRNTQDKAGDPAALQQLSDALQWDLRIFEERGKAVSYVCETPALIEQRLGALARAIQAAMG